VNCFQTERASLSVSLVKLSLDLSWPANQLLAPSLEKRERSSIQIQFGFFATFDSDSISALDHTGASYLFLKTT